MRMRKWWVAVAGCVVFAVAPAQARKRAPKKTTTPSIEQAPAEAAAPAETTTKLAQTSGTIPDTLAGKWLVIDHLKGPKGYSNSWTVYDIAHSGAEWRVTRLLGKIPSLTKALSAASQSRQIFVPDAATLQAVQQALPALHPVRSPEQPLISTADNLRTASRTAHPQTQLALEFLEQSKGHVIAGGRSYFITAISSDKLNGELEIGAVSNPTGPVIVPMGVAGLFTMYRLPAQAP